MEMSCRVEALKRPYAPDIEAACVDARVESADGTSATPRSDTPSGTDQRGGNTSPIVGSPSLSTAPPSAKRARTHAPPPASPPIDFRAITSALHAIHQNSSRTEASSSTTSMHLPARSVDASAIDLTREQISSYVHAEVKSLRRRKILQPRTGTTRRPTQRRVDAFAHTRDTAYVLNSSSGSDSDGETAAKRHADDSIMAKAMDTARNVTATNMPSLDERKEFSLRDVETIVARLLAQQRMRMQSEFERVLQERLQEQSENFLVYTQDSIKREMEAHAERAYSYVS